MSKKIQGPVEEKRKQQRSITSGLNKKIMNTRQGVHATVPWRGGGVKRESVLGNKSS